MRGISLALTGSPEEFEGERAGDPFWVIRNIGYPGEPTPDGPDPTDEIGWYCNIAAVGACTFI